MIAFTLTGTLMAEPRPGQLTNETINASTRESLENPKLDAGMRAYYERCLAEPRAREARASDGERYTMLRIDHEGRRLEVSVIGKLVDQAVELEPGAQLRMRCELTGQEPYFHIRAIRLTTIDEET